jgi:cell wall assembly regulator SMI1
VDRSVAESWTSITGWLEAHVPEAIEYLQPPAPFGAISSLRAGMGRRLPSDLLAWLGLNNGFKHRGPFGNLLPSLHTPLPVEKMLPRREMLRSISARCARPGEQEPAGTYSQQWLDGFLPISDTGTDVDLIVDLRDGELNGCVGEFSSDRGFGSPYWMSIGEMLADVADALTLDRPALVGYARRQQAASPNAKGSVRRPYLINDEDEAELHWSHVDLDDQMVGPE